MDDKTYVAVPLQTSIDIQLGPDGHPWVRVSFSANCIASQIVFPVENAEDVISSLSEGIRRAVGMSVKKQIETIMPDFTDVEVSNGHQ